MDINDYKKEIAKIENDISSLKDYTDTNNPISTQKKGIFSSVFKYKYYMFVGVLNFLFLYIVKPKCILKIVINCNNEVELKINVKKFMLWWVIMNIVTFSFIYIKTTSSCKKNK